MAPVLFNLYTCFVVECWHRKIHDVEGVGVTVRYNYDEKLFRLRYTGNAMEENINKCQFADYGVLLGSTRAGAEVAVKIFREQHLTLDCQSAFLKQSMHMVVGREVGDGDRTPISLSGDEIESVEDFSYLGFIIATSGRVDVDVDKRVSEASRAFGALKKAACVFRACVFKL